MRLPENPFPALLGKTLRPRTGTAMTAAKFAFLALAAIAVMLFVALSDALTPSADAQSNGCLKVTMIEGDAVFFLDLVDKDGNLLGLNNRQIGRSITLRGWGLDNPKIYIRISGTTDPIKDENKIKEEDHGSYRIVGYEDGGGRASRRVRLQRCCDSQGTG